MLILSCQIFDKNIDIQIDLVKKIPGKRNRVGRYGLFLDQGQCLPFLYPEKSDLWAILQETLVVFL